MAKKEFHIGDVLSITTGLLVSPTRIDGVYDILNFMTGDNLFTHQLGRAADECKPHLLKQFPQLDSPQMDFAVAELKEMLKTPSGKSDPDHLVTGWLSKLTSDQYGVQVQEMLAVEPLPQGDHLQIDPMEELGAMVGDDKVIPIIIGDEQQ